MYFEVNVQKINLFCDSAGFFYPSRPILSPAASPCATSASTHVANRALNPSVARTRATKSRASSSASRQIVQHALGDVPWVGFFAGGEIARHHLYGYTGVLTVFRS